MTCWECALERIAAGEACVLVTICAAQGSSPREAGAHMLVWANGQNGTVGGGNLEYILTRQAWRMLAAGEGFAVQEYPLGPLLSQCCGGKVRVLLERVDADRAHFLDALRMAETSGRPYLIETSVTGGEIRKCVLEDRDRQDGNTISLFDKLGLPLDPKAPCHADFVMLEAVDPQRPHLVLFGAGHVGRAVARIVSTLPFATAWYDGREEYRGTNVAGLHVETCADPAEAVARVQAGSFFLVFTHSHPLDYALVHAIMARGDFRYCGVIGSKTKRARFEQRLRTDGIAPGDIARLDCPIGKIGLNSKAPEIVAVAVAAELLLALETKQTELMRKVAHGH